MTVPNPAIPTNPTTINKTDLMNQPNLIEVFAEHVEQYGLVGEKENACVAFLSAVSAKLGNPLHLVVQGNSSAGKNHLLNSVCAFIPAEDKKIISGMTSKVLMYSEEDEFQHKAVVIAEYEGARKADYAIRTFQSEKEIQWEYIDTGKGIKKKKNTVKGPAAFLTATTESVLHPENETRLIFTEVDESARQTREINLRQALVAMGRYSTDQETIPAWHELLRSLKKDMSIQIPFAMQFVQYFPARLRSRRDFQKLLGLIQVSAFLHQHHRSRTPNGEIIAEPLDYLIAKKLFEHCYNFGPDKKVEQLLGFAEKIAEEKTEFTVADIQRESAWGHTKAYELLNRAMEVGSLAQGSERGKYVFLRKSAIPALNLPDTVEAGDFPEFRNEIPQQELSMMYR